MLTPRVTKCLKKKSAVGVQVIVVVLLEYNTAFVSLKHKFQLNYTQKNIFYLAVSTVTFNSERDVNTL